MEIRRAPILWLVSSGVASVANESRNRASASQKSESCTASSSDS